MKHLLLLGILCGCVTDIVADGAHVQDCEEEHAYCDGRCIDVHENPDNCGDCDVVCGDDEFCHDGACACRVGLRSCDDVCVNQSIDPANCGQCGLTCSAQESCVAGQCVAQ